MTDVRAIITVDHPETAVVYLDDVGVDASTFGSEAIQVRLDVDRGDRAVSKKDGSVEIVQDAMVGTVTGAEIVEVRD